MTALSPVSYLNGASTTEAQFQEGIGNLQNFVTELLGGAGAEALTIASNSITPTKAYMIVETTALAASTNLNTIVPTNHPDGRLIAVRNTAVGRNVVLKNLAGGTGQMALNGGVDITLDDPSKVVFLRYVASSTRWVEEFRHGWGELWGGTSTNVTNAYSVTVNGPAGAYYVGMTIRLIVNAANTGAATLNVNGLGAKSITKNGTTALASGDMPINSVATVTYDGTQFQLVSVPGGSGDVTGPGSSTDGHIPKFSGTGGKTLADGYALDTDTTLAANSDSNIASQKAVKAYADLKAALAAVNAFTKAQRGTPVVLTDAATIAVDASLGNNFEVQLGGNRTLGVPTNVAAGQSGSFQVYQDSTGSWTLAYSWCYGFAGGTAPTLTTTALGRDKLSYDVVRGQSATVTITIAAPGVVTYTGHGLKTGDWVQITTTGALPTGLTASTTYWVIYNDANSFWLATSKANAAAGTKIATSGSQSGTHTLACINIDIAAAKDFH